MRIAILGLGEAGLTFAREILGAGANVIGWDPRFAGQSSVANVPIGESVLSTAANADVILSMNRASVALEVAREIESSLLQDQLFADLNTAAPDHKREIAKVIQGKGALFADVALMAPVPMNGLRTPALVSGPGAEKFIGVFSPFGMPIDNLGVEVGIAATRKLLRSIFMKGLAGAVLECLATASALNCRDWAYREISKELGKADETLLSRLVNGSVMHAERRIQEMEAVVHMERHAGIDPHVSMAVLLQLRSMASHADKS